MALIVEDGSIVPNADTYVSRADYIAFAASINVTIPDDDVADSELRLSAQFIDSHEKRLIGHGVKRDQPMAYPRNSLLIEGWSWSHEEIPRQVLMAQLIIALEIHAGDDPHNPMIDLPVIRQKVEGAVEVERAKPDGSFRLTRSSRARALLSSLMRNNGLTLIRS